MVSKLDTKLRMQLEAAKQAGVLRQRQQFDAVDDPLSSDLYHLGKRYHNFSGNDYLGLASSECLQQAAVEGVKQYGVGSAASPLVSGYSDAHQALERSLCDATGHEAALLFCSGFSANSALMQTLFDRNDYVVCDRLLHASLIDGLLHSGAKFNRFKHNDINHAQQLLSKQQPSAIVTESVFSMDGDVAPINALYQLAQEAQCWLIVDDAHGFGVQPSYPSPEALSAQSCDIQVVTFGKALGCQGAAILASQLVIDYLVANARHYIYSTALSPLNAHIAFNAVQSVRQGDERRTQLKRNIEFFKQCCSDYQVATLAVSSPIQPIVIGDNDKVLTLAANLKHQGFLVGAIRPPTVPKGSARLRVTLSALHSQSQIKDLVIAIAQGLKELSPLQQQD